MSIDLKTMPKLGFGLMRLPEQDGRIDLEQVCRMADAYLEAGLNYFDTAYVYHGGNSEKIVKEALVKRHPRGSFTVATKLPAWCMKEEADRDRIFNEQLERTGLEFFDFYLLHSIEDGPNGETYDRLKCFEWGLEKKAAGKIRHFGFSFHGSPEYLEALLNAHPEVEFVQIQLNYADWENPVVQSGKLYEILHRHNMPIIVMEPVKGGTLAKLTPELEAKFKAVHRQVRRLLGAAVRGFPAGRDDRALRHEQPGTDGGQPGHLHPFRAVERQREGSRRGRAQDHHGRGADRLHRLPLLHRRLPNAHRHSRRIPRREHHEALRRRIPPEGLLPQPGRAGQRARRRLRGLRPVRGRLSPAPAHHRTVEGRQRKAGRIGSAETAGCLKAHHRQ